MIEIGDKKTFIPCPNYQNLSNEAQLRKKVTGTVIQIHEEHRWYRVEYNLSARCIGHECFKMEGEDYHENNGNS